MATIEIPDSMVPEGMLIDADRPPCLSVTNGMATGYVTVCIPIRRKPRLKQIVFTVAGDRPPKKGEWIERADGSFGEVDHDYEARSPRTVFTRKEVYE